MKKIITLFAIVGLVAFSSCEGPEGPEGPPGYDGLIAQVIEVNGYSFQDSNNFRLRYNFKAPIYPGDMVLVYRLVAIEDGVKIWNPLPESAFDSNGAFDFSYNFEFSRFDVDVFMLGYDLGTVSPGLRLNQTFRIVIIPGDGINLTGKKSSVNLNDYNAVIKKYNIDDSNVESVKL
jgi:hypothetical protein